MKDQKRVCWRQWSISPKFPPVGCQTCSIRCAYSWREVGVLPHRMVICRLVYSRLCALATPLQRWAAFVRGRPRFQPLFWALFGLTCGQA
jgi:hypothetical protein